MRHEELSSVGTEVMDTSECQVSDLEDNDFHWEPFDFNMDAVFGPSVDTPFSLSTFTKCEMGSMSENPILIDEEQDRKNSPLPRPPTSTVSERPTHTLVLMRSCRTGTRSDSVANYVHETF